MAKQRTFDYSAAKRAGVSDEEIFQELTQAYPQYDAEKALQSGVTVEEINQYLSSYKPPKKSFSEKALRTAGQFALGAAEAAALPYEIAVAPLAIPGGQETLGDLFTRDILSDVYPTEEEGKDVNPRELKEPIDLSIRGLVEKATGIDLHPEGSIEKAAHWVGFIKNPKNAKELFKLGTTPKEVIKSVMPTGKDIARGLGAGTALQMAEEGKFGPLGTIGAAVVGDLVGAGVAGVGKSLTKPKETLAKGLAFFKNSKNAIKSDLKEAIEETKFTKDIGTLTENNIIQMVQARLTASGLTGKPLESLRKEMTREVVDEYKNIMDQLGNERFATLIEAGETGKQFITDIRNAEKKRIGELYTKASTSIAEEEGVRATKLINSLNKIESQLSPGTLKSTEQKAVLDILDKIRTDIQTPNGIAKKALIKDLMNDKIALNEIINYEVQGGQKQLLKQLVHEIDETLMSHGKDNLEFVKNYTKANKQFSKHAKEFRNEIVDAILRKDDPMTIINKMNSIQGIRDVRKALSKTPEGKQAFNDIARKKIDLMLGDNLTDSVTGQLKSGKFVGLMHKPKNLEILKELLPPEAFKELLKLEKHAGKLAEAGQKFFNASQSATAATDLAAVGSVLQGVWALLHGNPFILTVSGGTIGLFKYASHLIADPKFLKMVEEAIAASEKNNISLMNKVAQKMVDQMQQSIPASVVSQTSNP